MIIIVINYKVVTM